MVLCLLCLCTNTCSFFELGADAASVFARRVGAWTQVAVLVGADTSSTDKYANRIAVAEDLMVVSSHADNQAGAPRYTHRQTFAIDITLCVSIGYGMIYIHSYLS